VSRHGLRRQEGGREEERRSCSPIDRRIRIFGFISQIPYNQSIDRVEVSLGVHQRKIPKMSMKIKRKVVCLLHWPYWWFLFKGTKIHCFFINPAPVRTSQRCRMRVQTARLTLYFAHRSLHHKYQPITKLTESKTRQAGGRNSDLIAVAVVHWTGQ
jgi:hypothetical protein